MNNLNDSVAVKQSFNSSRETIWSAITDHDQMIKWYFENIPAFKAEVGFETRFNVHSGGRDFLHLWKVTEVIPYTLISYTWNYLDYPGDGLVSFEITDKNEAIVLTVTTQGIESFPQEVPEFQRESCRAGWNYFIKQRLKEYLEP